MEILRSGIRIFSVLGEEPNVPSKALFARCGYAEHRDIVYLAKRDDRGA